MPDAPPTQAEKAERFHALHRGAEPFILANAFDAGSARILAGLGFEALGTTSGGFAGTLGRCDGEVTRDEALDHARAVVDAVDLPVSADLENGFGHEPEEAAKTVALAAEAGLVGCTIEDFTGDTANPFYDRDLAAERIAAAAEAARSAGFRFMLTARSECFIRGLPDLDEVIARLQAYERAGADVLMAPALPDIAAVEAVCRAVSKPVNFMVGVAGRSFPVADLAAAGVSRISLATSLYRAAMSGVVAAVAEVSEKGTFSYVDSVMSSPEIAGYMRR